MLTAQASVDIKQPSGRLLGERETKAGPVER